MEFLHSLAWLPLRNCYIFLKNIYIYIWKERKWSLFHFLFVQSNLSRMCFRLNMYDSDVTELSNVSNGRPPHQVSDWRSGCAVVQNSPQFCFIVLFVRYHSILTLYIYNKSNLIIKRKRAPSLTHKITHITQQVTWQSCYEGTDSNLWFIFRCLSP